MVPVVAAALMAAPVVSTVEAVVEDPTVAEAAATAVAAGIANLIL
jgi:hypothetical protein